MTVQSKPKTYIRVGEEQTSNQQATCDYITVNVVVDVIVCITSHATSTTEQQHLQPNKAVVGHPPAWSAGSC